MKKTKPSVDPEIVEFEAALLRAIDQTARGEGCVTAPEQIKARRVGRPAGIDAALKDWLRTHSPV